MYSEVSSRLMLSEPDPGLLSPPPAGVGSVCSDGVSGAVVGDAGCVAFSSPGSVFIVGIEGRVGEGALPPVRVAQAMEARTRTIRTERNRRILPFMKNLLETVNEELVSNQYN